jgi:hypothetical protein
MPTEDAENITNPRPDFDQPVAQLNNPFTIPPMTTAPPPPPPFNEREADFDVDYTTAFSRPDLHHRRCLFKNDVGYWGPNYQDYLPREEAAIYTVGDALRNSLRYTTLEILKDKPLPPACKMEDRFTLNFIETLKLSPNNPTLRAHMMRNLKIMPPGELDTFEKLKEWVEKNFPPLPQMMASAPTRQPTARGPELELTYLASDTERGVAYYSVGRSGMTKSRVNLADLEEWINEDIDMADLIQRLQEDAVDNDDSDMSWDGDPEYTEHGPDDSSNYFCVAEGGNAAVETNVRNFLESHAPHLLERLNNH